MTVAEGHLVNGFVLIEVHNQFRINAVFRHFRSSSWLLLVSLQIS